MQDAGLPFSCKVFVCGGPTGEVFEASLTDGASYHFENQVAVSYLNKWYPNQASSAARFLKPDRKTQATGNGSVALETFPDFP